MFTGPQWKKNGDPGFCYEYYKDLEDRCEDVEDDDCLGRPSTTISDENMEKNDDVDISIGSFNFFFCFWCFGYETYETAMNCGCSVATNEVTNNEKLLKDIITSDET